MVLTRPGALRIEDYERDGLHMWVLAGRLNRATAPAFNATMALLCAQGVSGISLDLGRLRSVDSAGLRAISVARELCKSHGFELSLTPLSRLNAPQRRLIANRWKTGDQHRASRRIAGR
jgi:anti-anti-sigma regulatory factor